MPSKTASGGSFDRATIIQVWCKATVVPGRDPAVIRKDSCGAWIAYAEYGMTTDLGWEIDHDYPQSRGGGDELSNLQPLHWKNNRSKGDDYPRWTCSVTATS